MFVDSHCHLSSPELLGRLAEVRAAMRAVRVDRALVICTTLDEFAQVHALALGDEGFWCSVGVHPDEEDAREPTVEELVALAARPKVVAIGETGLDYYRLGDRRIVDMAWQRERFRVHIRAARASCRPLVIHTRSASADTLAALREEEGGAAGGVFHCFTETAEVARAALDLGFHISFSGILTFRNASELREVAAFVPLDRCLIETDSPYLAPMPFRGKLNTPANLPLVAAKLAEIKRVSVERIAEATTANFERLFLGSVPRS
ncbi:MAG: TatD family hydrolase [Caldimonas sp.]